MFSILLPHESRNYRPVGTTTPNSRRWTRKLLGSAPMWLFRRKLLPIFSSSLFLSSAIIPISRRLMPMGYSIGSDAWLSDRISSWISKVSSVIRMSWEEGSHWLPTTLSWRRSRRSGNGTKRAAKCCQSLNTDRPLAATCKWFP